MTNWRTLPRTGKSHFTPLIPEVRQRLELGQNYKQIHDALVEASQTTLGYQQFVKYINKLIAPQTGKKPTSPKTPVSDDTPDLEPHPFAHLSAPNEKRRNPDSDIHNPVPDPKKIYV